MRSYKIKDNYTYLEYDSEALFYNALDDYLNDGYTISEGVYLAIELKRDREFLLLSYLHIDNPSLDIKLQIKELYTPYRITLPSFDDTQMNIIGDIRRNFGYDSKYKNKVSLFKRHYNKVAFILLDGLGENILFNNLDENSFLRRHYVRSINAIYPSTTAAATTAIITGLEPIESGWVGWENYFPRLNKNIVLFNGMDQDTLEMTGVTGFDLMPIKPFFSDMNIKAIELMPDFSNHDYDFKLTLDKSLKLFKENEVMYQYLYCTNPDSIMHGSGTFSDKTKAFLADVDKKISDYAKALDEDTILFITADHGHTNVERLMLKENKRLYRMLNRRPCNEGRSIVFDVKDEYKSEFELLFNSLYKDIYKLYKSEDAIALGFYGAGKPHERIKIALGNYVAFAINKYYFHYMDSPLGNDFVFKSHHAGITSDEMRIPLIMYEGGND